MKHFLDEYFKDCLILFNEVEVVGLIDWVFDESNFFP
jgi:hypothetical protein